MDNYQNVIKVLAMECRYISNTNGSITMTELLVQNSKISKSSKGEYRVFNFGIPALQAADGTVMCMMAGECAAGCYAQMGSYTWKQVQAAYEYRLAATRRDTFTDEMQLLIEAKLNTAVRKGQRLAIRVHDSGDYYSVEYINKWLYIMRANPDVLFYSYTKMVPLFKRLRELGKLPDNFVVIYSEGGKADQLIDTNTDRHARVFGSVEELEAAGYDNASADDTVAFTSKSGKIGLVYHGYKSKQWVTRGNAA